MFKRQRLRALILLASTMALLAIVTPTRAASNPTTAPSRELRPINLSLQPDNNPDSVYAPPAPARPEEGVNQGGVHFDLSFGYFTDYIFRGVELFELPQFNPDLSAAEDRANLQIEAKLSWDLGKLPHPFVGVFANITESDPISTFQEIRPYVGAELTLRPFIFSAGYTSYIYPDRDAQETSEVWGKIQLDDSYFLKSDRPLLSPYLLIVYDIDLYNGWYFEAGVKHDFAIEDTGLTLTPYAHVAFVQGFELFATQPDQEILGFQHYQVGLIANYSLNTLLNVSTRYGNWSIIGYLNYTDGLENELRADTQVWGGMGIGFKY
jgi:hypothetical protein